MILNGTATAPDTLLGVVADREIAGTTPVSFGIIPGVIRLKV
jgi:hypothetical protein